MGKMIQNWIDLRFALAADAFRDECNNWRIGGVEPQLTVIRMEPLPSKPSFKIAPHATHYRRCTTRREAENVLDYFRGQCAARACFLAFFGLL
jgi:hypothetical protein